MDVFITEDEHEMMTKPISHIERAFLLNNDYWSWPRERDLAEARGADKIFNVVWFLSTHEGMSEQLARAKVGEMMRTELSMWLDTKAQFYLDYPNLRPDLVKFLEGLSTAYAGNDYWSSQCWRHQDWTHIPEHPSKDHPTVHELANLGLARASNGGQSQSSSPGDSTEDRTVSVTSNSTSGLITGAHEFSRQRIDSLNPGTVIHLPSEADDIVLEISPSLPHTSVPTRRPSSLEAPEHDTPDLSIIMAPINYVQSLPSKGLRKDVVECLNEWLNVPAQELEIIVKVINSLHDSSLILDDIEDGALLRRGFPATHTVYGTSQSVNSSTFLYLQAVQAVNELENKQMMEVLLRHLTQLFQGQSLDLYWTFHQRCPSEKDYLDMVGNKTGALFEMIVNLMIAASPTSLQKSHANHNIQEAFKQFSSLIGRFFQVRDDYMDITSVDYANKKGFCQDLDERKFSYMMVYTWKRNPEIRDQIQGLFKSMEQGQVDVFKTKKFIVSLLERSGSLAATKAMLLQWQEKIAQQINILEGLFLQANPALHLLLETLKIASDI
jgi:ophiobolin F synthase